MPKGDWEVSLSGNLFNEKDLSFYLDVLQLAQRRGFNRFIEKVHVASYGEDPREPGRVPDNSELVRAIQPLTSEPYAAVSNDSAEARPITGQFIGELDAQTVRVGDVLRPNPLTGKYVTVSNDPEQW